MATTTTQIDIEQVVCDHRIYPRISRLDTATDRYASAMKRGDQFPPIVVTRINGSVYLVDGYHRLNAALKLGRKTFEAQFIRCRSLADAYVEGVKRNAQHGEPFNEAERTIITTSLKEMGYTDGDISNILRIDQPDIERTIIRTIERQPLFVKRRVEVLEENKDDPPGSSLSQNGLGPAPPVGTPLIGFHATIDASKNVTCTGDRVLCKEYPVKKCGMFPGSHMHWKCPKCLHEYCWYEFFDGGSEVQQPTREEKKLLIPVYDFETSMVETLAEAAHELWIEHTTSFARSYPVKEGTVHNWKRKWIPYHDLDEDDKGRYRLWAKRALAKLQFRK